MTLLPSIGPLLPPAPLPPANALVITNKPINPLVPEKTLAENIKACAAQYCTPQYVKERVYAMCRGRAKPLSLPLDLQNQVTTHIAKIHMFRAFISRLKEKQTPIDAKIKEFTDDLVKIDKSISDLEKNPNLNAAEKKSQIQRLQHRKLPYQQKLELQKKLKEPLTKTLDSFSKQIDERQKKIVDIYSKAKFDHIPVQVLCLIGNISGFIVPGSGLGIGLATTLVTAIVRTKKAEEIGRNTNDKEYAAREKRSAYLRTLCGVAFAIGGIGLYYLRKQFNA